jgi:glycosyltransferase involved in cell wall biosynthesis
VKISILTPDFSNNCFGRAWLLAKLLKTVYDIEVIGPGSTGDIWSPLSASCDFDVKMVRKYPNGKFEFRKMLSLITGDVIYASKPVTASFGVALAKKIESGKPLILDIDDYEINLAKEFYNSLPWYKKINDFRLSITDCYSHYYKIILNKFTGFSNGITVSGKTLQNIYGGTIIWHARDTKIFDPEKYNNKYLKNVYLPQKYHNFFIIGFVGTPRPHKGLEDLIDAFSQLRNNSILLMIVGPPDDKYCLDLRERVDDYRLRDTVYFLAEQPFEKLPEILSIIDLIVIPQRERPASYGQVPAKIFDAMAMAKPIIATNTYDLYEIIDGCGLLVEPEDPRLLAETINYVLTHPSEAREMGRKAREKCKREFSWDVARENLIEVFGNYGPR